MSHYSWDVLKSYPFRFAGYSYGIAEALRGPASPALVRNCHFVAYGFIFARTIYTPFRVSQKTQSPVKIILWTCDTVFYEILASGAMPVFFAGAVKKLVSKAMPNKPFPGTARLWTPALAGVAILPIIIPLTDDALDWVMDGTVRAMYR